MDDAAASGLQRHGRMVSEADRLEAQAKEMQDRAARLRQVSAGIARGNEGEQRIGARLDVLHGAGWHVLHDRRKSRRSPANLDHVVVGPPGVLVVDAKNWSSGPLLLDGRGMRLARWRKDDVLRAAKADADLVADVVHAVAPGVPCCGVLAFVQDMGLPQPVVHHGVAVLQEGQLLPWATQLPRRLDVSQVEVIAEHLERELRPRAATATGTRDRAEAPGSTNADERRTDHIEAPRLRDAPPAPRRRPAARSGRRHGLRTDLVKATLAVLFLVTLPHTTPIFFEQVAAPVSERISHSIVDRLGDTAPAAPHAP